MAEEFAALVERPGMIPAPYMARNMWVQEQELGEALDRRELEGLLKASYALVVAKLPKSKQPGSPKPRRGEGGPGARKTTRSRARRRR